MTDNELALLAEVRDIVRTLAPAAKSETALCRLVYDVLSATNVDPRAAALEDIKGLMLVAVRAYRQSQTPEFAENGT